MGPVCNFRRGSDIDLLLVSLSYGGSWKMIADISDEDAPLLKNLENNLFLLKFSEDITIWYSAFIIGGWILWATIEKMFG